MKTLQPLVTAAANRRAGFSWAVLIPYIVEMVQIIMQQCAQTEDQFVEMATNPSWLQATLLHHRALAAVRREGSTPIRYRRAVANQIVEDLVAQAGESEQGLRAAYAELRN